MIKFEKSVVIDAPQTAVFDFITDLTNDSQWQTGVQTVEKTSDGPIQPGTTWKYVSHFLGRDVEAQIEVTSYDAPNEVKFKTISGPIPFENTVRFSAQEGGTLVSISGQAEFGGFFKLAEGLVSKQLNKQIDKDTEVLKNLLEAK